MPLCTQDDVEKLLQIDFGADPDASVAQYIAQADALITAYCGQSLESSETTETLEAEQDQSYLILSRFPVTAVASVVEGDVTLTTPDDFHWYTDGRIRRLYGTYDGSWSTYPDSVVVTYTAGYSTIPADLVLASATLAAALFRQGAAFAAHGVNPVKSVALDGSDTIVYDTSAVSQEPVRVQGSVAAILSPYRKRTM
jgi:hypothetical protein